MRTKAQMELLGLAIIIILVSLGMLFVVRFALMSPVDDIKKEYTYTEMASNELNAILKSTTMDCKGTDLTELLQDCAISENIMCENGERSCKYANDTIYYILNATLTQWKKTYAFNVSVNGVELIYFEEGDIREDVDRQTKLFPVPLDSGTMIVKLMIYG